MATDLEQKENLPELTDRIVATYEEIGTIHHLGHCPLPSTEAIIQIAQSIKEIIFPGYRRRQNLHLGNVVYHIGNLIDSLHDQMTQQIARALRHDYSQRVNSECSESSEIDFEKVGQEKTIQFLGKRFQTFVANSPKMLQAAYDGDPAAHGLDEIIFCYPGFRSNYRFIESPTPCIK